MLCSLLVRTAHAEHSAHPSSIFFCSCSLLLLNACSIFISTVTISLQGTPDASSNLLRFCSVAADLSPHNLTPNQNAAAELTLKGKANLPKHSAIARVALCTTKLLFSPSLLHQFTKTPSGLRFLTGIFFTELEDDVVLTPFLVFSERVVSVLEMQSEDRVLEEEKE
ncbi:hypothetical protein OIU78_005956 [Salix suchowensis]|nr:hypothetical protein OIU78_005956 [Salix suchowensis]